MVVADISKFFKDSRGNVVLGQKPNAPLLLWLIFIVISWIASGAVGSVAGILAQISIATWALLELFFGVSMFRRLLGFLVLSMLVLTLIF